LPPYRGRFAPSPTGPLHFGSLVAAVGSYLHARAAGGEWLVRMEDLDTPRCVPGAAEGILRTLERYGFAWDGDIMYQSARTEAYRAALESLKQRGLAYPCACSRKEVELRYPGTCRGGIAPGRTARSWRVRTDDDDFILLRADGIFAYQLAVVVDDEAQGITHVVRGADLLDSTPRQVYLQRLLGYPTPAYVHLPLALNEAGQKLSKQTRAPAIDDMPAGATLLAALRFLGHAPPLELDPASPSEIWRWAQAAVI
jgi:glutamyl-Q tRNA(Asp) synthetase